MAPYYALTLKIWRENVEARPAEVRARGFDGSFLRKWRYYLCYCEAAFGARPITVDRWSQAALNGACFGFLAFFIWVVDKEADILCSILCSILIMLLGNMSACGLIQLGKVRAAARLRDVRLRP